MSIGLIGEVWKLLKSNIEAGDVDEDKPNPRSLAAETRAK